MKNKDPAFLFYSSDFLTGTILFSDEQVGKYIRLMCLQHQKGHLKEADIIKMCGSFDDDIMSKFAKDDDGLFYNLRLEAEIEKRTKYAESRRKNRTSKQNDNTYVKHMENENENININKDINNDADKNANFEGESPPLKKEDTKKESCDGKTLFNQFWAEYPKKKSKGDAEKAWKSINPNSELLTKMLNCLQKAKSSLDWQKDGGQFIPYPASWLRAKGWEDEFAEKQNTGGKASGTTNPISRDYKPSTGYSSKL